MKKLLALMLVLVTVFALAACKKNDPAATTKPGAEGPKIMSHAEFFAAEEKEDVVVEFYVQANQSWWDNKITVYGQDKSGGSYVSYEMQCSEEKAAKLVPGTKIRVSGTKLIHEGMHEVYQGTCEILTGDTWIAPVTNVTDLLGTDSLIKHTGKYVSFTAMTVENISFKGDAPGDDIYVTVSKDGAQYDFCVEVYLTGTETEVYNAVKDLTPGTVIDVEGFLWWWNGPNPHITNITVIPAE